MINNIKEIVSTSKKVVVERVKSPLISSFVVAWLAFNWKAVSVMLLSNKTIEEKIIQIEAYSNTNHALWLPLMVAVFYAVIYPFINYLLFMAHHGFEKNAEILKCKNAIEVLEIKVKEAQLESRLEQNKFNAQQRLEEDKIQNQYRLESQKLDLEMKRLEMEQELQEKLKN